MSKTLLDCGNCGPDFHAIRQMVSNHFGASVVQSHGVEDTLELLRNQSVDLVTVNRKLDRDYSDGLDVAVALWSPCGVVFRLSLVAPLPRFNHWCIARAK